MRRSLAALALTAVFGVSPPASAFCGFYVGGAGAKLFNNATQVALMRDGTRTVLSMANNYQGPPENFAMVVPVPVVLQKEQVKTLPHDLFARLDQLSSPRLVEYWEQDPCPPQFGLGFGIGATAKGAGMAPPADAFKPEARPRPTVKIEAQFVVGEYDIVILSASDSMGLDTWLRQNGYNIPQGAEEYLRPYVAGGMKFFVARVDIGKVKKEGEKTMLSPLRFFYDSDTFALPIRLGLANSGGTQDLIVHVLAPGQRYEVANYPNVAIPTNLNVKNSVKQQFGPFYAALFDQTLKKHPRAIVTEYSWDATTCDPCPGPALSAQDLALLGVDVTASAPPRPGRPGRRLGGGMTLTRLHTRYSKETLGEDLVFREAKPIVGGREFVVDDAGTLEKGARPDSTNNFQARYAIRYPWMGAIACKNPQRGVWGGPPNDTGDEAPVPAVNLAFVPRRNIDPFPLIKASAPVEASLLGSAERVATTMPQGLLAAPSAGPAASVAPEPPPGGSADPTPAASVTPLAPVPPPPAPARGGCAGCHLSPAGASLPAGLSLLTAVFLRLRRRRSP